MHTTTAPNAFALISALPSSFREVHGVRPLHFAGHAAMTAWLRRMDAATLESAAALLAVVEVAGDARAAAECGQYLAAHQAIAALRVA